MKLLDKHELQKTKADDRQRDIREGAKLAKQVDALRTLVAKEQANLLKFRNETLARIQEEIDALIGERDTVKDEVRVLTQEKKDLLVPLTLEWDKVNKAKEEVAQAQKSVKETLDSLRQTEANSLKQTKEIQLEARRVEDLKHTAMISLKNSESIKVETRSLLVEAQLYYDKTVEESTKAMREIETQKRELDYKKVDLDNREKSLSKRETQLFKDQLILKDREGVLERKAKRL